MGEARRRGTFENRKAQAIAKGRDKKPTMSAHRKRQLERGIAQDLMTRFCPWLDPAFLHIYKQ